MAASFGRIASGKKLRLDHRSGTSFADRSGVVTDKKWQATIMRHTSRKHGTILKIVRVRFAPSTTCGGGNASIESIEGYGILKGSDGEELYFVDEALQNALLSDLRAGQSVDYTLDVGPLQRASKIWIYDSHATRTLGDVPSETV